MGRMPVQSTNQLNPATSVLSVVKWLQLESILVSSSSVNHHFYPGNRRIFQRGPRSGQNLLRAKSEANCDQKVQFQLCTRGVFWRSLRRPPTDHASSPRDKKPLVSLVSHLKGLHKIVSVHARAQTPWNCVYNFSVFKQKRIQYPRPQHTAWICLSETRKCMYFLRTDHV